MAAGIVGPGTSTTTSSRFLRDSRSRSARGTYLATLQFKILNRAESRTAIQGSFGASSVVVNSTRPILVGVPLWTLMRYVDFLGST